MLALTSSFSVCIHFLVFFSQEAFFSEYGLITPSFSLKLCSQAHQFSFRLCSQSCCRPLHDHLKYMEITGSALTFHLHLVLHRSPFFTPEGVSLGTGWCNAHSHCCRGTTRTRAFRPSTDNAHSQFVCGTTPHRDFSQHRLSPAPSDSCRKRAQSQRKQVCSVSHLSKVSA